MSIGSIAAIAVDSLAGTAPASATQPTAQQAARFAQQLQGPALSELAHYGPSLAETPGIGGDLHSMMDYVGQISSKFGANLKRSADAIDMPNLPPELQQSLQLQKEFSETVQNMNNATLEIAVIGKGTELAENVPKTLFQQT
jgi:hypothetical protein